MVAPLLTIADAPLGKKTRAAPLSATPPQLDVASKDASVAPDQKCVSAVVLSTVSTMTARRASR